MDEFYNMHKEILMEKFKDELASGKANDGYGTTVPWKTYQDFIKHLRIC